MNSIFLFRSRLTFHRYLISFQTFAFASKKKKGLTDINTAKKFHDDLLGYTINNKQFMLQISEDSGAFGEMLSKI